jgi:predicted phage-related endonuclease
MADFSHEHRAKGWYASDTRKAVSGKANEVILIKQGKLSVEDLSHIEAVQMGHVMEPVIGKLASEKLGIELTKIEEELSHPKETWLKSHFDFAGKLNGKTILVEAKNYHINARSKFDKETGVIPPSDFYQCVHEATVFGCDKVYLAVLFGGQEFEMFPVDVSEEMKDEFIRQMAMYWGHVVAGTHLPAESTEQAKLLYKDAGEQKVASSQAEHICQQLFQIKRQIKDLEDQEEKAQTMLQEYMKEASSLVSVDGSVLATWKAAKPSKRFSSSLFQQSMPDVYNSFVVEQPGSRRFLVKGQ